MPYRHYPSPAPAQNSHVTVERAWSILGSSAGMEVSMQCIGKSLAFLALMAPPRPALTQANLAIQNHKPESPTLNLPYTADYDVSSVQHLADGTTIARHITGHALS